MGREPEGRGLTEPSFSATPFPNGFGADELLACYAHGVFPMGETRDDPRIFLVEPEQRGVVPLDGFHIPARLRRTVRGELFDVRVNTAFDAVLDGCAASAAGREDTWINAPIRSLYLQLHHRGHAHSLECWRDEVLVGGLYGVTLGGAFFGESMFTRVTDASKVALVHLVARLRLGGWTLLDAQFLTDHLSRFGAVETPQADYLKLLRPALIVQPQTATLIRPMSGVEAVQVASRP